VVDTRIGYLHGAWPRLKDEWLREKGLGGIKPDAPSCRNTLSSPKPRGKLAEAVRPSSTQKHPKPAGPARVFPSRVHRTLFAILVNQPARSELAEFVQIDALEKGTRRPSER
jgi:hypothetical protein